MSDIIRGVSFYVPQGISDTLFKILKCIDIEQFRWSSIDEQGEIWDEHFGDGTGQPFLTEESYSGRQFKRLARKPHFVIFVKLQAYREGGVFCDIHSYEGFLASDCQLLLLIYDCSNVDIYAKDLAVCEALYQNAKESGFTDVEYVTDGNDTRTATDVL